MVHHAETKRFTQRSPGRSAYSTMGGPLARLTRGAAKLAWLCRFHAKAAACARCWELVCPCDNPSTSLFLGQIVWHCWCLLGKPAWFIQRVRPSLLFFFLPDLKLWLRQKRWGSELSLAPVMLSGPKYTAWLTHYACLTRWPDQDPLRALLLPEEVYWLNRRCQRILTLISNRIKRRLVRI